MQFTTDYTDNHRWIIPGYPKRKRIAQIHPAATRGSLGLPAGMGCPRICTRSSPQIPQITQIGFRGCPTGNHENKGVGGMHRCYKCAIPTGFMPISNWKMKQSIIHWKSNYRFPHWKTYRRVRACPYRANMPLPCHFR